MNSRRGSITVEQRLRQMCARLKEANFRLTPQRLAVLKVLAASEGHPSVERIYDIVRADFPSTSIATIYKTVALLKQLNEVLELGFPDGSNRYDGFRPHPHPHVICTRCKKIIDPDLGGLTDLTIHGKVPPRHENVEFIYGEYGIGDFYRSFTIGETIDADKISAELNNGVLTLHLPKTDEVKPRRIEVKAG